MADRPNSTFKPEDEELTQPGSVLSIEAIYKKVYCAIRVNDTDEPGTAFSNWREKLEQTAFPLMGNDGLSLTGAFPKGPSEQMNNETTKSE